MTLVAAMRISSVRLRRVYVLTCSGFVGIQTLLLRPSALRGCIIKEFLPVKSCELATID